ncbi:MAG: S8 family serine peptidase [Lewinella sp.]|nr:S8 family serine peptidase [Lewinella sp.]
MAFLSLVLLTTAGCPRPSSSCLSKLPALDYSQDPNDPRLVSLTGLNQAEVPAETLELPNFCSGLDYTNARVLRLAKSTSSQVILHHYQGFLGQTHLELIGYRCEDQKSTLLSDACWSSSSVASSQTLAVGKATDYDVLLLRVVVKFKAGADDQAEAKRELLLAAFTKLDAPKGSKGEAENGGPLLAASGDRYQRLVFSANNPGFDLNAFASAYGLGAAKQCPCNSNLIAFDVPYGIDLNTVKPKVTSIPPVVDTFGSGVAVDFDWVVRTPIFAFRPNNDPSQGQEDSLSSLGVKRPPSAVFKPECVAFSTAKRLRGGPLLTIIDSGVDATGHGPLFAQNAVGEQTVCGGFNLGKFGFDFLRGDENPIDALGHGTGVAGAILSTYPANLPLRLQHFKFIDADGGSFFAALCAMHTAVASRTDVMNLSWGLRLDTLPPALATALAAAEKANVLVVTSAGNDSSDLSLDHNWPGSASPRYRNLVTVGAYILSSSSAAPTRVPFSNYHDKMVGLLAPYGLTVPGLGEFFTNKSVPPSLRPKLQPCCWPSGPASQVLIWLLLYKI